MTRITAKQFKALPGVHNSKQDLTLPTSNVYSTAELVLIKWINLHLKKEGNNRRINNFDKDLSDGLVFATLILSHIPTVKRLTTMYQFCTEKEHYQHNANNIVGAIKDLGFDYNVTIKDILEPNPCGKCCHGYALFLPITYRRYDFLLFVFVSYVTTISTTVSG